MSKYRILHNDWQYKIQQFAGWYPFGFWFNVSWGLPPNHYTKTKAEAEELIKKWNKREIEQNSKWRVIKTL